MTKKSVPKKPRILYSESIREVCPLCKGTGVLWDREVPHNSEPIKKLCDACNGLRVVKKITTLESIVE